MAAAVLLALAGSALAQAPRFELPPVPAAAGPGLGVDGERVVIRRLRFEGHTRLSTAELEALAAPFLDRPLRALDLEELRLRLTRAHVDRGLVNSGALLADDALAGDTLTVRIVEGQVTRVRVNGAGRLTDRYLSSRLVRSGEVLDVNVLQERFQLLLADPQFQRLNVRLQPGDAPGRALLDVDVTPARQWQVSAFANNHVAPAVGSSAVGVDGSVRNLVGWGDTLTGLVSHTRGSTNYDLAWTLPLGGTRTTATLRAARASSSVIEEPVASLDMASTVDTGEFTLAHPFIDEARRRWAVGLTYADRRNRTTLDGEPFVLVAGQDGDTARTRTVRLFQDFTLRADRHVVAARLTWAQGRNNVLPVDALVVPARRYQLWQLQAQASLALDDAGRQVLLRGQLQKAMEHLVPMEQMALGGRYTVRGYRENTLVRDNGWALSAELQWPLWRDDGRRASVTLVPFADGGAGWNQAGARQRLASAGLGLQWAWGDLEGDLYVAHRFVRRDPDTRGDLQDHGIHLSLRYRPTF